MPEYTGQEYRYEYNEEYGIWGCVLINSDYIESLESLVNRDSFYGRNELRNKQWADIKAAAKYAESFGLVTYYKFNGYNEVIFRSPFHNWDSMSRQWDRLHSFAKSLPMPSMQFDAFLSVLGVTNPDISESNPDLWAYYQNTTKQALAGSDGEGIRTQIKYGKLLKKLFPMATDDQISAEVESWKEERAKASLPLEYVIATDSESFKLAYQGDQAPTLNPKLGWPYKSLQNSCMRYSLEESYWRDCDGFHPAQAYASGSFAIVYATQAGRIAGRAIVPYDKDTGKLCGVSAPIYTTSDSVSSGLRAFIESNGAIFTDDSYGVCKDWVNRKLKLCRIELDNGGLLMPYVDCIDSCEDTGKALLLTDSGDISCRPTEGYTELDERETCHACDERVDSDEAWHDDNDHCYCESCYDERFFYCDRAGETVELDDTTFVYIRGSWSSSSRFYLERVSDSWRDENCTKATDNGEYYETDECIFIQDEAYSPYFEGYATCEVTQELFLDSDLAYIENPGIYINLDLLRSDKAWQCVNGQWQLAEGYEFTNRYGTTWALISFEDVEPALIESEYAIAAE